MEIVRWLEQQGGKVNPSLRVEYAPTKGNYLSASATPGQLLIEVPAPVLVNAKTLGVSEDSHTNLAKYLYTTKNTWTDSIPPIELPLAWPQPDIDRLPLHYRNRILEQQAEIKAGMELVGIHPLDIKRWVWAWSSVNSRCLYWDVGLEQKDQMTLAPLVDFFNHSTDPTNCITIKKKLGKMCAYAPQEPTQDLNLFYGPHENAFLLVEYGFVPSSNQWDHLDISEEVLKLAIDTKTLEALGYLGNYTLGAEGPCFRTMVALASMTSTPKEIERYAQGIDEIPCIRHILDPLYKRLKDRYTPKASDRKEVKALFEGYLDILQKLE